MTDQFKARCAAFFDAADADGTGCLTRLELAKVCVNSGCNKSMDEISGWFDDLDANDDDKVGKDEFLSAICDKIPPNDIKEADLRAAFKEMDCDGSGCITIDELKEVLEKNGEDPEKANLDCDHNDDGKIVFEEFVKAWRANYA